MHSAFIVGKVQILRILTVQILAIHVRVVMISLNHIQIVNMDRVLMMMKMQVILKLIVKIIIAILVVIHQIKMMKIHEHHRQVTKKKKKMKMMKQNDSY
jgi:hypothetical protein